jgi:hypothetical protein
MIDLIEKDAGQKITIEINQSLYQKQSLAICDPAYTEERIQRMGAASTNHPEHPHLNSVCYFMEIEDKILTIVDSAFPPMPNPLAIIGRNEENIESMIMLDQEGRTLSRKLYQLILEKSDPELQKEFMQQFLKYYDTKIKPKIKVDEGEQPIITEVKARALEHAFSHRAA